jgi:Winged helix DNA-binding domain
MGYLMMHAELEGLVCSGPRRAKQFTYALLDERVPPSKTMELEEALVELAHRYFVSRGPATINDFARWSGLTVADARIGLEGVQPSLVLEVVEGKTFWSSPVKRGSVIAHFTDRTLVVDLRRVRVRIQGSQCHHQSAERRPAISHV